MSARDLGALAAFLVLTFAAAAVGSQFLPGEWYAGLQKPSWTPPGWLFAPVWSVLYLMIAIAGWLLWRAGGVTLALGLWAVQLLLNAVWSPLMFGLHRIDLAAIDIVLLLATIVATIVAAMPRSRAAALLLVPYVAWVGFAATLNLTLLSLNP